MPLLLDELGGKSLSLVGTWNPRNFNKATEFNIFSRTIILKSNGEAVDESFFTYHECDCSVGISNTVHDRLDGYVDRNNDLEVTYIVRSMGALLLQDRRLPAGAIILNMDSPDPPVSWSG